MAGYTSGTFDPGQRILLFPFYFLDCDCLVVSGSGDCFKHLGQHSDRALCSAAYFASSGEIGSRAHEVDETIIGVRPAIRVDRSVIAALENDSDGMPEEAATLYDWFLSSNHASDVKENTEITATGVVTYIGTDIHGLPSFRLSDSADGNCYVHACLASSGGYGNIKVGDEITVKGNFHILSDEWGVVLKNSVVL